MERKRQKRYDDTHIITVSTRLTRTENAVLEAYCIAHRMTRYSLLKEGIALYIATNRRGKGT